MIVVKRMKPVDAVEVVRCKDCKWFDPVRQECCGSGERNFFVQNHSVQIWWYTRR